MKYLISISVSLFVFGWVFVSFQPFFDDQERIVSEPTPTGVAIPDDRQETLPVASEPSPMAIVEPDLSEPLVTPSVFQVVPFTSQAPSVQWDDPVFQNACEEASMIMAAAWAASEESLPSRGVIETEIRSVSALAEKRFGKNSYDTSAEDTAALYRGYFQSEAASVLHDFTLGDLRNILREGSIVIAPMDGRRLGNPHYTSPGPEYHMLVIIGYDAETGEFVTNDPGTRHGAGYRYAEDVLFGAMADYPTGHHLPRPSAARKSAIGIGRIPGTGRP